MALAAALLAIPSAAAAAQGHTPRSYGVVEFDKQSDYSHIRVRKQGSVYTLMFVRDSGEEYIQSMVNMKRPYELLNAYCRAMFASYLVQPHPQRMLIVGLGGGAMVHFLEHYDKDLRVDALEIDPVVAQAADRFFNVRTPRQRPRPRGRRLPLPGRDGPDVRRDLHGRLFEAVGADRLDRQAVVVEDRSDSTRRCRSI